jgi:hypothetical protein
MGDYTSLTLITSLKLSFVLLSISVQSSLQTWCPSYDSCSGLGVRVSSCSGSCRKGRYAAAEEASTRPMMGAMFLILRYL